MSYIFIGVPMTEKSSFSRYLPQYRIAAKIMIKEEFGSGPQMERQDGGERVRRTEILRPELTSDWSIRSLVIFTAIS